MARTSRSGFTLLELLLVLVVLVVMAGVAAASFSGGADRRAAEHTAARLAASLRSARERAILTGRRHRAVVEVDGRSAWLEDEVDPLDGPGEFEETPGLWGRGTGHAAIVEGDGVIAEVDFDVEFELPDEAVEEDDRAYVYFEASGLARDATFVVRAGDEERRVRLVGFTGRAAVLTDEQVEEALEEDEEPALVWEAVEDSK